MQQHTNLPPPTHDPFAQPEEERDQDPSSLDLADDDHDKLQRGMPGRNLRTWGVITLGTVVIAALVWPRSSERTEKPNTVIRSEQSISDELAGRAQSGVDSPKSGSASSVSPTPSSAPSSAPMPPTPAMPSTVTAKGTDGRSEDERAMMILASPMSVDVELRNKGNVPQKKPPEPDSATKELAMLRAAVANIGGGGASPASEKAPQRIDESTHSAFLNDAKSKRTEPPLGLSQSQGPYTIYEGTLIRTVLTRSLHTDVPGKITAKVMSDVYDSVTMNTLVIPRGSEVTCSYQSEILVGQEVVLAACERLRLPNGRSFSLAGTPAGNLEGASGLPADVNNHFWKMFKTSFMLGAVSLLLPSDDRRVSTDSSFGSNKTSGTILSMSLYDTIQQTLSRNSKIKPTASVEIGTPFTLTISRDVEMEPYLSR